jgi:hypothetical protein
MSPPGRPRGEFRSAQHEGTPVTPLFKKLNLRQPVQILVLNAPDSFEPELVALKVTATPAPLRNPDDAPRVGFGIAFVATQQTLEAACRALLHLHGPDPVLWIAYPKQSSKRLRCEFNRDSGWPVLAAAGFEPVRMVAIDDDWSALRFRRVEHIKQLTRDPQRALTARGKARTARMLS